MKIRIGKPLPRETKTGKTAYSQAINVLQFPAQDAVIWHRAFNDTQLYEPGYYDADVLFVNTEWTNPEGKVIRQLDVRFINLQPLQ